jgi:hypothetical protein
MIHITEANIGNGRIATRRAGIRRVIDRTHRSSVSTWCELQRDERGWATDMRPDATWVGTQTLCPIQVGPGLVVLDHKITEIFAGQPKYSPPLHLVEVTVRRKWLPRSRPVHIISCHLAPDFGNHHATYVREQASEWGQLRGAVADARGRGLNVIVSGDFNVRGFVPMPEAHPDQIIAARSGLDAVLAIPAPGRKVKSAGIAFPLGIERQHKGLDVRISFPRA